MVTIKRILYRYQMIIVLAMRWRLLILRCIIQRIQPKALMRKCTPSLWKPEHIRKLAFYSWRFSHLSASPDRWKRLACGRRYKRDRKPQIDRDWNLWKCWRRFWKSNIKCPVADQKADEGKQYSVKSCCSPQKVVRERMSAETLGPLELFSKRNFFLGYTSKRNFTIISSAVWGYKAHFALSKGHKHSPAAKGFSCTSLLPW